MIQFVKSIKILFRSEKVPFFCLAALLLAHILHYLANYEIKMVNDEWEYLTVTQSFLKGHFIIEYPPYDVLKEKFGTSAIDTISDMFFQKNSSGDLVPIISIGIILLLAPFYILFGNHIFYLLPLLFDCIALISMFLIGRFFWRKNTTEKLSWYFGLLYTSSYAVIVNFRPGLRRDLLCASLMVPLTLLVLRGIQKNRRLLWYMAFGIISFLSIVKPTYILLYVPFMLSFAASNGFRLRSLPPRDIITFLLLALIIFAPYFIHNHYITGSFLIPKQIGSVRTFIPRGNPVVYFLNNAAIIAKAQAGIFSPSDLNNLWSIPVIIVILAGFVAKRKEPFVRYWIAPALLLFYVFHLFTRRHDFIYNIYLAPTYFLSIFLFTAGITAAIGVLKNRNTILLLICFFLTGIFFTVKFYKVFPGRRDSCFQLSDANALKQMVETAVPPGSLIICDRFLCYVIDYFTNAYSVSPWMLSGKEGLLTAKIDFLLSHGISVFFCTYDGVENAPSNLPLLQKKYQLEECNSFQNGDLNLGAYKGGNQITLYSICKTTNTDMNKSID